MIITRIFEDTRDRSASNSNIVDTMISKGIEVIPVGEELPVEILTGDPRTSSEVTKPMPLSGTKTNLTKPRTPVSKSEPSYTQTERLIT